MNIQTVAKNLRVTIALKEEMLSSQTSYLDAYSGGERMAVYATIKFLKINIDELKRTLQDVEQCVFDYDELKENLKEANGRVRQLEQQASYNLDGPMIKMFRED
jgi:FtsZ-binding cell division protein ZapB